MVCLLRLGELGGLPFRKPALNVRRRASVPACLPAFLPMLLLQLPEQGTTKAWRAAGRQRLGGRWPTTSRADEALPLAPPGANDTAGTPSCAFLQLPALVSTIPPQTPHPTVRTARTRHDTPDKETTKWQIVCHFQDPDSRRAISRSLPLPLLAFACPCRGTPWGESVPPADVPCPQQRNPHNPQTAGRILRQALSV